MYYIPIGILAKSSFGELAGISSAKLASLNSGGLFYNLIFSTAGNIIGGGVIISLIHSDDKEQALQDVDDHLKGKTKKDFREDRRNKVKNYRCL